MVSVKGKGVRNIYRPAEQTAFTLGEVESFRESAIRNGRKPNTRLLLFTEFRVDKNLALKTGFSENAEIYYIQRLHYLDNGGARDTALREVGNGESRGSAEE